MTYTTDRQPSPCLKTSKEASTHFHHGDDPERASLLDPTSPARPSRRPFRARAPLLAILLLIPLALWGARHLPHLPRSSRPPVQLADMAKNASLQDEWEAIQNETASLGIARGVQRSWSNYSPYYPAGSYESPPEGCVVDQVHLLQRHGARFPTSGSEGRILQALGKLKAAAPYEDPAFAFLERFRWMLGQADLIPLGAAQSFDAGGVHYSRYAHLVGPEYNADQMPFVRASDASRVVDSAHNWSAGFAAASGNRWHPLLSVIIDENVGANNTLDDNWCPAHNADRGPETAFLIRGLSAALERIHRIAPKATTFDTDDVRELLGACAFDTLARWVPDPSSSPSAPEDGYSSSGGHGSPSPLCALFSPSFESDDESNEWASYARAADIEKWFDVGPGNKLGPVQGVGYIAELLARLTDKPVEDGTSTDAGLYFPLGRRMYVDFSHEGAMNAVYAAMGLFYDAEEGVAVSGLKDGGIWAGEGEGEGEEDGGAEVAKKKHKHKNKEAEKKDRKRASKVPETWRARDMVPFSGRMVVERLKCDASYAPSSPSNDDMGDLDFEDELDSNSDLDAVKKKKDKYPDTYVRVLVDDALQPLAFCGAGEDGVCSLKKFVKSQKFARKTGQKRWEKCFACKSGIKKRKNKC
ncbi:phosphoglycerate mutase-like protein [Coniophora puteana RWD-64-598 SS2]|uniref:Phosphoglycerate mutase-like protein n=1 Tax=Coniophora puteana (strain RWD-64-598) TaxID=741705 RepID=A0A5M3MC73_CONPW|nr:phosphoglycerate mutase-like protein [Coniophora puteana RWD-64-598 SS2]EIW76440.1 phosphoglycerate mutase-like protein [Coniophora puteana RWD-64-598 SS2]